MQQFRKRLGEVTLGVVAFASGAMLLMLPTFWAKAQPPSSSAALGTTPSVQAELDLSRPPPVASYTLNVELNAEAHTLTGSGTLRFTNTTPKPTRELYFHLYLNAFKNTKTLFQRSEFHGARSNRKANRPGYIDVETLTALEFGNVDLWSTAERHSAGDPDDETDIKVPLPRDLEPGATITLQVTWKAQLPELTERTGFYQDFHMVAQWFPKLARLEQSGEWAHFPFHANAEFYADFGDYEVTINVPKSHTVGSTGELLSTKNAHERTSHTYQALGVHDFAWTSWPQFKTHEETIDGVRLRLLYPDSASLLVDRELASLRFALPHFRSLYGQYPYPTLTVVHPPTQADAAGGMEYPTLITTGGKFRDNLFSRSIELVTVHELGHQWFYGLVASNEAQSPFLDEGLNSYAEALAMRRNFGNASAGKLWDLEVSLDSLIRAQAALAEHDDAIANAAAEFPNFSSLGALVYSRTATILQSVAGVAGEQQLLSALGDYTRRNRFGHPTAQTFIAHMQAALGAQLGKALHSLLTERGWLDYSANDLRSTLATHSHGVFETNTGRVTRPVATEPSKDQWIGEVLIRRHGTVSLPVEIDLIAADGSVTHRTWNGVEPWIRLDYSGSSELVAAIVDPHLKLPIDSNLLNNSITKTAANTARSFERLLYATQLLLSVSNL